jgi:hypothetical protein
MELIVGVASSTRGRVPDRSARRSVADAEQRQWRQELSTADGTFHRWPSQSRPATVDCIDCALSQCQGLLLFGFVAVRVCCCSGWCTVADRFCLGVVVVIHTAIRKVHGRCAAQRRIAANPNHRHVVARLAFRAVPGADLLVFDIQ